MGLAGWHYLWRTTSVHRTEESVSDRIDVPELPARWVDDRLRRSEDGVGPLFHRRYRTRICGARMGPEELMARITRNPNRASPREVAVFRKTAGAANRMDIGDEFLIRMPGPWDGPVRVVHRTPRSFRFATLEGHLEAGQIEFRAGSEGGHHVFEIESWARGGDPLSFLLYDRLRLAKEMQLHMWTHFLERVAQLAGGRMAGGIDIDTRRHVEVERGR